MNIRSHRYETLTFEKAVPVDVAVARDRADGCGSSWVACGGTCGLWLCLRAVPVAMPFATQKWSPVHAKQKFVRNLSKTTGKLTFSDGGARAQTNQAKKRASRVRGTCFFCAG